MAVDSFTQFQAARHPEILAPAGPSVEAYVLYEMQRYDYLAVRELVRGKEVLDWGCNNGYGMAELEPHVTSVIGLDVSESLIEIARRKHPRLRFDLFDGERTGFADGSFDAILMFQVLEHIRDPLSVLIETKRLLRPGGVLVITTPNEVLRLNGAAPWNPFHAREYDAKALRTLTSPIFDTVSVEGLDALREVRDIELARISQRRFSAYVRQAVKRSIEADPTPELREQAARFNVFATAKTRPRLTVSDLQRMQSLQDLFHYRSDGLDGCFSLRCNCVR